MPLLAVEALIGQHNFLVVSSESLGGFNCLGASLVLPLPMAFLVVVLDGTHI